MFLFRTRFRRKTSCGGNDNGFPRFETRGKPGELAVTDVLAGRYSAGDGPGVGTDNIAIFCPSFKKVPPVHTQQLHDEPESLVELLRQLDGWKVDEQGR